MTLDHQESHGNGHGHGSRASGREGRASDYGDHPSGRVCVTF